MTAPKTEAKASHTPGPWLIESDYNEDGSDLIVMAEQAYVIADTRHESCGIVDADECYANARLISAAPELLEALKGLLRRIDDHFGSPDASHDWKEQEAARAALSKATGGAA